MLIYVKNIKKEKKNFYGQTDKQTDGQPKTIVRNLTKKKLTSFEQDLAQTNSIQLSVHLDLVQDLKTRRLRILGSLDPWGGQNAVASQELGKQQPGRITLAANTNTFQHTVAVQLVHDQMSVQNTTRLQLVGNDTANEMGTGSVQGLHQLVQLLSVGSWYGHGRFATFATLATFVKNNYDI